MQRRQYYSNRESYHYFARTLFVLALIAFSTLALSAVQFSRNSSLPYSSAASSSWHQGSNQTTPLVDVNYTEMFTTGPNINSNQTLDRLDADMVLNYQDGTGEWVSFGVSYSFANGGMDLADDQVLNWSKVVDAGLTLLTVGNVNNTRLGTMYNFMGFNIVNGSASQFSLSKNYPTQNDTNNFSYSVNNIVGSINYANATSITIGAVALSTANTTYNAQTLTESIARFNVTVDAVMSDLPLPPISPFLQNATVSSVSVPVVLMFQITHDIVQTEVKYGVSIDWSANEAFPTATEEITTPNNSSLIPNALKSGDNFSLVAADRLSFGYGPANGGPNSTTTYATTFTTDPENDSAIYIVNGTQLCRELFPTNYTINGSPQVMNTTRVYIPVSFNSTWDQSSIYIVYGGFEYNESSGFAFDPAVITPNTVSYSVPQNHSSTETITTISGSSASNTSKSSNTSNSFIFVIPVAVVISAIAAGALIMLRRRKVSG